MADIFISYSSKDRAQAEQLTELLASAGLSVWIDKQGIDVATSWSGEIVDAIDDCTAMVVLLSPSSVESKNVVREVALAFEKNKKILPLDLEPVPLSRDLQYHLAGIQHASMTNIDAIIRALGKLGLQATRTPQAPTIAKEIDGRKSLIILPFEDLSPTGDNQWFADGLAGELIDVLGQIKSLKVLDLKSSLGLRGIVQNTIEIGRLFNTRYFIEGSVRKFGDQIKISVSLLDIETGDHLWYDTYRGEFKDIFDIQETVAKNVVQGLKLHITRGEAAHLEERGTNNAEAYELAVRARQYFLLQTQAAHTIAVELLEEAIRLDPLYAFAYQLKAKSLTALYTQYGKRPELLSQAMELVQTALKLRPNLWIIYSALSQIYQLQGDLEKAEEAARTFIAHAPNEYLSHYSLGKVFLESGQPAKAIAPFEQAFTCDPENLSLLTNIVVACDQAGNEEKTLYWAQIAVPLYQRHLKLHPDDNFVRVYFAYMLFHAHEVERAKEVLRTTNDIQDTNLLFTTACMYCLIGDYHNGYLELRKCIEFGFRDIERLHSFLNKDFAEQRGTSEHTELTAVVQKLEDQLNRANG